MNVSSGLASLLDIIDANSKCYVDFPGALPVVVGAEPSVRNALIKDDGPTGGFFDRHGPHNR